MLIYLAGPYRGKSKIPLINWWQRQRNIAKARETAKNLWQSGHAVICPHMNTANFDGIVPDEVFLRGTMEMMERCDCVALLSGWETSSGTLAERRRAEELGITVVEVDYFWM